MYNAITQIEKTGPYYQLRLKRGGRIRRHAPQSRLLIGT
jgi:hypothetical protein